MWQSVAEFPICAAKRSTQREVEVFALQDRQNRNDCHYSRNSNYVRVGKCTIVVISSLASYMYKFAENTI
jgi:hypothetical protein